MTRPIGVFDGLSAASYHADVVALPGLDGDVDVTGFSDVPSLSCSIAKLLVNKSPAHARAAHPKLNPDLVRDDVDSSRFDVGTVAHQMLLEGSDDCLAVYEGRDWRKNEAKEFAAAARAEGKVPLLVAQADRVRDMVAAAVAQMDAYKLHPPLFKLGAPEQTIVWEDDHGVVCRARLDWLAHDHSAVDDYKTTSASSDPRRWEKTMYGIGGDMQVAFYMRGVEKITGTRPVFRFVVQETYEPYALSVVDLAPSALALAQDKVQTAIDRWAVCLEKDFWPAYPSSVASIEVPTWEEMRWLDQQQEEAA